MGDSTKSKCAPPQIERLFELDPGLRQYETDIVKRYEGFEVLRKRLELLEKEAEPHIKYSEAYKYFGMHIDANSGSVVWREWVPNVHAVHLTGEFNDWNRESHKFVQIAPTVWEIKLDGLEGGKCQLAHMTRVKLVITTGSGATVDRISPWATYVIPLPNCDDKAYHHFVWHPPAVDVYHFQHPKPKRPSGLRIYEAHIGIATAEMRPGVEVGNYHDFATKMLPRIAAQGYNALQLMAVMEHAYYGCFGYHVTSFYAASSRYGNPEMLKYMIDCAHALGIFVMLDIVHSHACKNVIDGLNQFNGTDGCFFYGGDRGSHSLWDSRIFDLTNTDVVRFLLSNANWYVDEYGFDGFRFDGVTSMLFHHHGLSRGFSGGYHEYFGMETDTDATAYLMLVNHFLHTKYPDMVTIAEEVSGFPALCRPISEGGMGFDYRLNMAVPDKWIKLLKEVRDDDWNMGDLCHTHTNRRYRELHVAYVESHDQLALVGDKSIAFWLMDAEMYTNMSTLQPASLVIERGIALHNIIRMMTHTLAGEAWLNFIGNEFGHPEWLDFPREGNKFSYHYARRQFNLVDDENLRYKYMYEFDKVLNHLEERYKWLHSEPAFVTLKHEDDKIIVFERANLLFCFNFHPSKSFADYRIPVRDHGDYVLLMHSDEGRFMGKDRLTFGIKYPSKDDNMGFRQRTINVYLPHRTACVFTTEGYENEVASKLY